MAVTTNNISNFLDVVDLIPQLYDPEENKFNVITPEEIRSLINDTFNSSSINHVCFKR